MLIALAALAAGCSSSEPRGEGEECFASSECAPGLVCDFGADPPVCAASGSPPGQPDAAPAPGDDAAPGIDASPGIDAAPGTDAAPPDAAPDASPPDAAPPDAAFG